MKQYKCIKQLILNMYDDDGASREERMVVNVGDVYTACENPDKLFIASEPAVHLELDDDFVHQWIEVLPETLAEYFEEITKI